MMEMIELIIKKEILNIERPFKISDLLKKLAEKNIKNIDLIFEILDQLINCGLVAYSDIIDNDIVYYSLLSKIA